MITLLCAIKPIPSHRFRVLRDSTRSIRDVEAISWHCSAQFRTFSAPIWQSVDRGTAASFARGHETLSTCGRREFSRRKKSSEAASAKEKRSQREEHSHDPIVEHLTPSMKLWKIEMKRCHWKRSVIVERMGVIGTRIEREDSRRKRGTMRRSRK